MMPIGQFGVKIQNHISSNSLQPWEQSEDKGSWATSCVCFSAFLYNSTTKHLFKHFCLTLTYDCEGPRLLTTGWIIGFPGEEVSYSCYVKKKNYFPMKLWNMINLQTMTFVSAVKYERYIGRFNGHQCWKVGKKTHEYGIPIMKICEKGGVAADILSAVERKEGLWRRSEAPWDINISTFPWSSCSSSSFSSFSSSFSSCFILAAEVPRDIIFSTIAVRTLPTPLNRKVWKVIKNLKWILVTMPQVTNKNIWAFPKYFPSLFRAISSGIHVCTAKCLNSRT